ncbi:ankyrin [Ascodesmis nigricans]|uniref:Ankyrin n=1 Tax=Ascodesmis nigricans TaxID=341454 RepID=A0A4S2MLD5_9PEZI|nr:ankyrin [Ascodesmis nigricans]
MAAILAEKVDVVNAVLGLEPVTDLRASPYGRPTPLQLAARLGNSKIFNILIEHRANVNAEAFPIAGHTALQAAIPGKHTSVAEGIIFNGADISAPLAKSNGLSTLRAAVIRGYLPFWNHVGNRSTLELAAYYGRLDIVQLLLNFGADVGGDIPTRAKKMALGRGHYAVAKLLAEKFMA